MAAHVGECSTVLPTSTSDRPLVVRVKRKAFHSPLEGFWLEISERPLKRSLIDFEKLSISDSSGKEALRTRRVFVKHVDTVSSSEATVEAVQSYVLPRPDDIKARENSGKQRRSSSKENKQDQLLSKAKQHQEALAKSARFEQIWRKRRENKEGVNDESLSEVCRLYDVVRVDSEETFPKEKQLEQMSEEDGESLSKFLPLLRELIPDAAEEIEYDLKFCRSGQDGYVYDLYTVEETIEEADNSCPCPLIQLNDDDQWYDGPDDSDCETDDSNAENNPLNDYPDELSVDDDEEKDSETSGNKSEEAITGSDESASTLAEDQESHLNLSEDEMDNDYYDDDDDVNGSHCDISDE